MVGVAGRTAAMSAAGMHSVPAQWGSADCAKSERAVFLVSGAGSASHLVRSSEEAEPVRYAVRMGRRAAAAV